MLVKYAIYFSLYVSSVTFRNDVFPVQCPLESRKL